jgi:DNA-3-methyladenine glycosylase II
MNKQIYYIPKPPLFNFSECLWFLDRRFDECLYRVSNTEVIKAILINGDAFLFSISENETDLVVGVLQGKPDAAQRKALLNYITDWFDLNTNMQPFYKLLSANKGLAYMCDEFNGLRLLGIPDLFEALCWSIIGQQINLTFAYKLKRRMVEAYGRQIIFEGTTYHLLPEPERLAQVTIPELRAMQFSDKKAEYVITVAKAFANGELSKGKLMALPDLEAKQQALTSLKGIGIWTANYALMKSLREPAIIPHGDVGLLNALENHSIIKTRTETEKIERLFKKFKGWESYLVFYLWRSLAIKSP